MKIFALFTLHETGWGTREGVGDQDAALDDARDPTELAPLTPDVRTPAWLERTDSDKRGSEKLLDHGPPVPLLPAHGHYRASAQA